MALPNPLSLGPPDRPNWRSALSTAQFGPIAEDLLAVTIEAAAGGLGTIARPIVDRGVDLYLRRLRSLLTIPVQVKAFQQVSPDGIGRFDGIHPGLVGADPARATSAPHSPAHRGRCPDDVARRHRPPVDGD